MAWTTSLVNSLRFYLGSPDTVEYPDATLQSFLVYGAAEAISEAGVEGYTADISAFTISPDPEADPSVSQLILLKSQIIIIRGEIRRYSRTAGYRITDDRSTIDGKSHLDALRDLLKQLESDYNKAEESYAAGDGRVYRAIISPNTP